MLASHLGATRDAAVIREIAFGWDLNKEKKPKQFEAIIYFVELSKPYNYQRHRVVCK